jgi:hypothetical protein
VVASSGASAGISTTYFGFINPWFGLDKKDKYWFNWLIYGFSTTLVAWKNGSIAPAKYVIKFY